MNIDVEQWLRRQMGIEELEAERAVNGIPFGSCHRDWEQLRSQAQPGDQIWTFCSPQETWDSFPHRG